MNTTNNNNNTAASSVTITLCNPFPGVLNFMVTLTTHKDVRSYPYRSMDSALKLAARFLKGVLKPDRQSEDAQNQAPSSSPTAADPVAA